MFLNPRLKLLVKDKHSTYWVHSQVPKKMKCCEDGPRFSILQTDFDCSWLRDGKLNWQDQNDEKLFSITDLCPLSFTTAYQKLCLSLARLFSLVLCNNSLLGPFASFKENEMSWRWPQVCNSSNRFWSFMTKRLQTELSRSEWRSVVLNNRLAPALIKHLLLRHTKICVCHWQDFSA